MSVTDANTSTFITFIHELYEHEEVGVCNVNLMTADIFAKPLDTIKFKDMCDRIIFNTAA